MAMGFEMLLKSFGFDPEEVKTQIGQAHGKLVEEMTSFHQQLNRIERNQQKILETQSELAERLETLEEKGVLANG